MSKQTYITRYLKIINYIKRGKASFEEISAYLQRQSEIEGLDLNISQRTLQRDLNEIRTIYQIDIKCNKSTGLYYISEEEDLNENQHLLATFDLFNALRLTSNYSDLIQFENANVKGSEHIYPLLQAIKGRCLTEIVYKKFYEDEPETILLEPYLLKQFKNKWYLICIKEKSQEIRTYALDRIINLDVKRRKFSITGKLDLKTYSKNSFGIITPTNQKVEKIVFSFDPEQANYVKNFPIHQSQKLVKEEDEAVIFQIEVYITYDLISDILSFGDAITIQSPKKLIRALKDSYIASSKKYA